MQIADFFQQFDVNTAANSSGAANAGNTSGSASVSGSVALAEVMRALPAGSVFEATVNQMEDGEVTLGLSDGRTVSARLTAGVQLSVGEAMFFQVKSNNGTQIEIRPFSTGPEGNPTLLKALEAAGLKVNDKNLTLVHSMMQEQLPIDKSSLMSMVRLAGKHPGVSPTTLVEMTKAGIPVTEENAAQFENYKTDQNVMMKELNQLLETVPQKAGDSSLSLKEAITFHNQITELIAGEEPDGTVTVKEQSQETGRVEINVQQQAGGVSEKNGQSEDAGAAKINGQLETGGIAEKNGQQGNISVVDENGQTRNNGMSDVMAKTEIAAVGAENALHVEENADGGKLRGILNEGQMQELKTVYAELSGSEKDISELSAKQFLNEIKNLLTDSDGGKEHTIRKLFGGKAYQQVVRSALESEWFLKPQDLQDSRKVNEFYARMGRQMGQLQQILTATGESTGTAQAASELQNNIDFMNVLNQTYTYVQIPLKLANQNTQGDLYVYTNKKHLMDKDGELSAFLHLDMEHLGSTDVSIKMLGKNVTTKFYLAGEEAYRIVAEHVPFLEEQLAKKGYQCKIDAENGEKKVNLVEDFLKKDKPSGGMVHRYSFDMRA